ncbi:MAG: septal ring lytic transglycosylase RlpA family protein [Thermodesulfovibrionales bacterium]
MIFVRNIIVMVLLVVFFIMLITSCAPVKRQPPPHIPPSPPLERPQVPLPPEREPQRETERIEGKRQRVIASWYGREFHGRPTASGEQFDMYALTCAHRDFPFGTMLRITNPQNNKTTQCTVNDRGPFVQGRDLDMSYGTAKEINFVGLGVGPVDIEPFARDLRYVKVVRGSIIAGVMTIQIGSFREESNAKRLKQGLDIRYKDVYITQVVINGIKYYRVRVGVFRDGNEIKTVAERLAKEGYDTLITKYEKM